ncbi:MAG: DUF1684 domain-containing protein [Candidatus Thorarchaeota archaeon]
MSEYLKRIIQFRNQKDEYFRSHPDSPIPGEVKTRFKGLEYFKIDENLCFNDVNLTEFQNPKDVYPMRRTGGDVVYYNVFGSVKFIIEGQEQELIVYTNPEVGSNYFFVPFWDETALTEETYGSGRYVELEKQRNGTFTLDFNLAYNPTCVYAPEYSCPLTPRENRLNVRIEAGEKNFPH